MTASNYSRLKNISAFLNGNEFYDLQAGHSEKTKTVYWVANETVRSYLEEDFNFFDGLEHNIEESIPVKVKKKLKSHFKSLDEEYEEPTSFWLTILHPYLFHFQLPVEDNYTLDLLKLNLPSPLPSFMILLPS